MKLKDSFSGKAKKAIDSYTVTVDAVPVTIKIKDVSGEPTPWYELVLPTLPPASRIILAALKEEVAQRLPVDPEKITDPEQAQLVREQYLDRIRSAVAEHFVSLDPKTAATFAGILLHDVYGLGDLEFVLGDNFLEEVVINGSKEPISVYHKKHGWCQTNLFIEDEEETKTFSAQIGRKIGRDITVLNPIMDAHLLTGDRVASTLFPVSTAGNTITIRRFARTPWTITHFLNEEYHNLSIEMAAFIWLAMQYELNVIVAGGTASGKTSVLNTLCSFIPPKQRIISVEDTREIVLPETLRWNWVPMSSRNPNPEGQGEVKMLDLIVAALRMRPDRIVVGEIRRSAQAEALFEAMHTGHSVYATMHADTVQQVKRRLVEPPIAVPLAELEALHLIIVQFRDRRHGRRRLLELAEILQGSSAKGDLELNYLYRWKARSDTFEKVNESIRIFEELNLHTGMTLQEIKQDLRDKERVLQWMLSQKMYDIEVVGRVMKMYYKEKEALLQLVKGNKPLPR